MDFGMQKNEPFRIFGLPKNILLEVCTTESAASLDVSDLLSAVPATFKTMFCHSRRDVNYH